MIYDIPPLFLLLFSEERMSNIQKPRWIKADGTEDPPRSPVLVHPKNESLSMLELELILFGRASKASGRLHVCVTWMDSLVRITHTHIFIDIFIYESNT